MPTPPRRRTAIAKRSKDTPDESDLDETSTMLVENYPDLDADSELPMDDGPRDVFAQNARALFKKRMKES